MIYHGEDLFIDDECLIEDALEYWFYIPMIGYILWWKNEKKFRYEVLRRNGLYSGKNYYRILGWCDFVVPKEHHVRFVENIIERCQL